MSNSEDAKLPSVWVNRAQVVSGGSMHGEGCWGSASSAYYSVEYVPRAKLDEASRERDCLLRFENDIKCALSRPGTDRSYVEWAKECRDAVDKLAEANKRIEKLEAELEGCVAPMWLDDLLSALGWQGGTAHDAITAVRRLVEAAEKRESREETRARVSDAEETRAPLASYVGVIGEIEQRLAKLEEREAKRAEAEQLKIALLAAEARVRELEAEVADVAQAAYAVGRATGAPAPLASYGGAIGEIEQRLAKIEEREAKREKAREAVLGACNQARRCSLQRLDIRATDALADAIEMLVREATE